MELLPGFNSSSELNFFQAFNDQIVGVHLQTGHHAHNLLQQTVDTDSFYIILTAGQAGTEAVTVKCDLLDFFIVQCFDELRSRIIFW